MVQALIDRGMAHVDQGALVIDLPGFVNKENQVRRHVSGQDGGYLYATTDIDLIEQAERRAPVLLAQRQPTLTEAQQQYATQVIDLGL